MFSPGEKSTRGISMRASVRIGCPLLVCCLLFVEMQSALAQASPIANPPLLQPDSAEPVRASKTLKLQSVASDAATTDGGNQFSLQALRDSRNEGREIKYTLPIQYTKGRIFNPATGQFDDVELRSYQSQFTAPTIRAVPGQTVRITLQNKLPADPNCATGHGPNDPHCFNTTNLHSHGLWVSPTGNSDNVLLSLDPGVEFQYEYNIPVDHPAGTFWYHPHKHGSTSVQVASGMAGVLLVQGDRAPTELSNGDLDTLLRPVTKLSSTDWGDVMLIQQIPYACFNEQGEIETNAEGRWICKEGQTGIVEKFSKQLVSQVWKKSGRYTSINGEVRRTFRMQSGKLYRWRLVQAGIRESVYLRIRKIEGAENKLQSIVANDEESAAEVARLCNGVDVQQFEVAADGLTRSQVFSKVKNPLQPGYRSDVLFVLPEPGNYCIYDDSAGEDAVQAGPGNPKILGLITALGDRVEDQSSYISNELIKSARQYPGEVGKQITADLRDGLKLSKFVPHAAISDAELAKYKLPPIPISFNIQSAPAGQNWPTQFQVNSSPYQSGRMDHTLILGTAQSWQLQADSGNHPFHIHVNPFEIISIKDRKTGNPVSVTDVEYAGMVGAWKDTLMVRSDVSIEVRMRYQRYIGEFVLHCHILDHEDQGMMQNVRIVLPNAQGGASHGAH